MLTNGRRTQRSNYLRLWEPYVTIILAYLPYSRNVRRKSPPVARPKSGKHSQVHQFWLKSLSPLWHAFFFLNQRSRKSKNIYRSLSLRHWVQCSWKPNGKRYELLSDLSLANETVLFRNDQYKVFHELWYLFPIIEPFYALKRSKYEKQDSTG